MLALYLAYLDNDSDKSLFEDIYYSYRKQMISLAISILHNEDDAEDVVHDVFYCIASKHMDIIKKITSKTDLRNYLLKAVKNTSLNMIKKKKRVNVSFDVISELNTDGASNLSDDTFLEVICQNLEYDEVVTAIHMLDEKYHNVLYYHFVMELTIPETAKALAQTTTTTKKQLVRGKKMLLSYLNKRDEKWELVNPNLKMHLEK